MPLRIKAPAPKPDISLYAAKRIADLETTVAELQRAVARREQQLKEKDALIRNLQKCSGFTGACTTLTGSLHSTEEALNAFMHIDWVTDFDT